MHFVNEELDAGPIILQRTVEVKDDDTAETLAVRILEKEHDAYIEAVRRIVRGGISINGKRTVYKQNTADEWSVLGRGV